MQQEYKNITQKVEREAIGGKEAIGARAINEARTEQPWGYIYL